MWGRVHQTSISGYIDIRKQSVIIVSYDTAMAGGDSYMGDSIAIQKVLSDVRTAIDEGKFKPIKRGKNRCTLSKLGLTWQDAKNEIYELTEKNYHSGPMIDRDDPQSDLFWVFKKSVDGHVIYIKFKVMYLEDKSVKVVSFHIDWT